jgi:hypothetical protein
MTTTLIDKNVKVSLNATNRCDRCSAKAMVWVRGKSGDLMFCGHHYNSIMDNAVGYDKMMKFAVEIIDERYKADNQNLEEMIKR